MADAVHDAARLKELQALPLERKIQITQTRIIEWYQHYNGNVCVSFSGGKDSTVLLHIARQLYPDIPAVFSNTGLEYPEIQRFVKSIDNVDIVTPAMRFDQVIFIYGYPLIGKEVAEAIYYARRIRSQTVNVEREREQSERTQGNRPTSASEPSWKGNGQAQKRLRGQVADRTEVAERLQNLGGQNLPSHSENPQTFRQKNSLIETSTARNRRTVLSGKMGGVQADEPVVVGKPMNHGRETDGCSTGSEVPPG